MPGAARLAGGDAGMARSLLGAALVLYAGYSLLARQLSAPAPALVGMWAGQKLRNRISLAMFRQLFLGFLLLLGAEMALRSLLYSKGEWPLFGCCMTASD